MKKNKPRRATLDDKRKISNLSHDELCIMLESSILVKEEHFRFILINDVLYSPRTFVELLETNQVAGT